MEIHIYPVGFFRDVKKLWGALKHAPTIAYKKRALRSFVYWFSRSWTRRSYWNGYLAEPTPFPEGLRKCGTGWTRFGAAMDLRKKLEGL